MAVARTMCHVGGTKNARPFVAPFSSKPQFGMTLLELLCPYFRGLNRRGWSNGKKLSIPSTSSTPATRRGAPSINSEAGLYARLVCALPHQTPSPENL